MPDKQPRIFSGIQPTGIITLGNYIGALRQWRDMSYDNDCIFCIVDQHAITVRQEPEALRTKCMEVLGLYIAAGIDPQKSILYLQSHVPQHAQLSWVLTCLSGMGELSRMTQFKDKSAKQESVYAGLFTYPCLMAADILLFDTDRVPVGEDQKQHVELTRDLALRFNSQYGETFVVPEPVIPKVGARIMGLSDPTKKMSKSDLSVGCIALLDPPELIRKKLRRAVTDLVGEINYDPENQPGICNLLTIYAALRGTTPQAAAGEFAGMGYGKLKDGVADVVIDVLEPLQNEFHRILADKAYINQTLKQGADRARALAQPKLEQVYEKVGFIVP